MDILESRIKELIDTFLGATGIHYICLDPDLNIHSDSQAGQMPKELEFTDFYELTVQLRLLVEANIEPGNDFATHITENQFIYNIHIIRVDNVLQCILLSEPMVIQPFSEQAIQEICTRRKYSIAEKIELTQVLAKVAVVKWQRVHQLGMIMHQLVNAISGHDGVHHLIGGVPPDFSDPTVVNNKIESILVNQLEIGPVEVTLFPKVKDIIQSGDLAALAEFERSFSFGDLPLKHLVSTEFLRVVKNYFIMFCTIELYCAIDAGMRNQEMLALAVRLMNEAEQMTQVSDVFAHMKLSLAAFTHAVNNFNKLRHSKSILELLSYIHDHYQEKITLQSLSAHIGLNPNYLSSLIHKETGQSLTDHVNKVRIEASKSDLLNSSKSISEIAQSVGFAYQNHYAQVFRKITGMSPMDYRERKSSERPKNIRRA